MQLPTLRRPVAASALAGIVGAGLIDAVLSSRAGATGQVLLLALGLYGAVALIVAFGVAVLAAALDAARPPRPARTAARPRSRPPSRRRARTLPPGAAG